MSTESKLLMRQCWKDAAPIIVGIGVELMASATDQVGAAVCKSPAKLRVLTTHEDEPAIERFQGYIDLAGYDRHRLASRILRTALKRLPTRFRGTLTIELTIIGQTHDRTTAIAIGDPVRRISEDWKGLAMRLSAQNSVKDKTLLHMFLGAPAVIDASAKAIQAAANLNTSAAAEHDGAVRLQMLKLLEKSGLPESVAQLLRSSLETTPPRTQSDDANEPDDYGQGPSRFGADERKEMESDNTPVWDPWRMAFGDDDQRDSPDGTSRQD